MVLGFDSVSHEYLLVVWRRRMRTAPIRRGGWIDTNHNHQEICPGDLCKLAQLLVLEARFLRVRIPPRAPCLVWGIDIVGNILSWHGRVSSSNLLSSTNTLEDEDQMASGTCLENKGASNGARGSIPPSSARQILDS